jgi:hypothetical protein
VTGKWIDASEELKNDDGQAVDICRCAILKIVK